MPPRIGCMPVSGIPDTENYVIYSSKCILQSIGILCRYDASVPTKIQRVRLRK